jgi:predicted kinase
MMIVMAGLPGTGKTTLARALAERLSGIVLNKDEIRNALFPSAEIEYSTEQDDFCMEVMLQTAAYILGKNPGRQVFLDGRPFAKRYQIERVIAAATKLGQTFRIMECVCSEATARERLEADRNAGSHPAADRNISLYRRIKESFETITVDKSVIDTDLPLSTCLDTALQAITAANEFRV